MALWILKPKNTLPDADNPWEPWYDKAFGIVVRADTAREAREVAQKSREQGAECAPEYLSGTFSATKAPWLDPKYSTCRRIRERGAAKAILLDVQSA